MIIVRRLELPYNEEHQGYVVPEGFYVMEFAEISPQQTAFITVAETVIDVEDGEAEDIS